MTVILRGSCSGCHKIIVHNSQQLQTRDGRIVGHVPLALARTFWYTAVTCRSRITDVRRRSEGKGLVVPCVYIFRGKTNHLEKLIAIFTSTSYVGRLSTYIFFGASVSEPHTVASTRHFLFGHRTSSLNVRSIFRCFI